MRLGSSSPEFGTNPGAVKIRGMGGGGISTQTLDYSGAEVGSFSSMSDGARISQLSLGGAIDSGAETEPPHPGVNRNMSGFSSHDAMDDSRVVWHGYLYCLKSKGGVKQWKKYWVVLRTANLTFYKTEEVPSPPRHAELDQILNIQTGIPSHQDSVTRHRRGRCRNRSHVEIQKALHAGHH